jgi:hypothetical protein
VRPFAVSAERCGPSASSPTSRSADIPKEDSHHDLPIALSLMIVMGILPADTLDLPTAMAWGLAATMLTP